MPEKESQIVKWIKELEGRRGKLDLQMDELDQQIAEITWRIAQLGEFRRQIEEGAIQVAQLWETYARNIDRVLKRKRFWKPFERGRLQLN